MDEKTGAGSGSFTGPDAGPLRGASPEPASEPEELFDHERLDVYRVAREFFVLASTIIKRKLPAETRDQLDRAAQSILANIGEGAGKTAKADKRRFYEIARGSTTEAATHLDMMRIRGYVSDAEYRKSRTLLIRTGKMLSRLCSDPRTT
jgi:four helix bundle protein